MESSACLQVNVFSSFSNVTCNNETLNRIKTHSTLPFDLVSEEAAKIQANLNLNLLNI